MLSVRWKMDFEWGLRLKINSLKFSTARAQATACEENLLQQPSSTQQTLVCSSCTELESRLLKTTRLFQK